MKMINAGSANILNFAPYSRNCNLSNTGHAYLAPIPSLADVQLFVNFGTSQPSSFEFSIIDLCNPNQNAVATPASYVIGWNGSYWYGVFKNFSSSVNYSAFIISLTTGTQTFFSEQYQIETDCETLTKVSVCYPDNYNAEDVNGVYIGKPDLTQPYSGNPNVFYSHNFWTRQGEIIETANKITFISNAYKNFATTLNKSFEFRPELMPGWYKDYLLSVYFRGNIMINGTPAIVTDLNFEDVDVDYWKAYAVLGKEVKGGFGCASIECPDETCHPATFTPPTFANAIAGQIYNKTVPISGTAPFYLTGVDVPDWMTATISGSNVIFTGTPLTGDIGSDSISFVVNNACGNFSYINGDIEVEATPCIPVEILTSTLPDGRQGTLYSAFINISGDAPFTLTNIVKPSWMSIAIFSDDKINCTGTPDAIEMDVAVSFTVNNCADSSADFSTTIDIAEGCQGRYNNSGVPQTITYRPCGSDETITETIPSGQSICGTDISGDGFFLDEGPC